MIANLQLITDIKKFNHVAANCPVDVKLTSGRMVVDGKTLNDIFTLNLSKPVKVELDTTDNEIIDKFKNELVGIVIDA